MQGETNSETLENSSELSQLRIRCDTYQIGLKEGKDADGGLYVLIPIKAGRKEHELRLSMRSDVRRLLEFPFERYHFLSDYFAVCSYQDNLIEAEVQPLNLNDERTRDFLFSPERHEEVEEVPLWERRNAKVFKCHRGNMKISMGPICDLVAFQDSLAGPFALYIRYFPLTPQVSLRIEGLQVSSHDQAVDILERTANSLFFQIDTALDVPLKLRRKEPPAPEDTVTEGHLEAFELQYPKTEYDNVPMQLYWYARRSVEMPLLQYLAYYQVMEFYFPTYSQAEAIRQAQTILKDPSFRADRSTDMARIVRVLQTRDNRGFGTEESQLEDTLRECVHEDDLMQFFTADSERMKWFSTRDKVLNGELIRINDKQADLRKAVAKRIYDIRCRIVHTKSDARDGEPNPILPFSEEAKLLHHDIALVQHLARKVLINASRSLDY